MADKTEEQLVEEIALLRKEVAELKQAKAERKRVEEETNRFLGVIETAREAINITYADGKIMYTNCAMDELFGYKRGDYLGNTRQS